MPRKIALTGGIATGKSTVAAMFAEKGALILDADKIAREAVRPGAPCWVRLKELLGPACFDPDGELNRRKVRDLIIGDEQCRNQVNAILHPAIIGAMDRAWEKAVEEDPRRTVIFDIPLLFEVGAADRFDVVILVYAPPEAQVERVMARDSVSRVQAEGALAMQLPIDAKRGAANCVIDNSLDLEAVRRQVEEAWSALRD